VSHFETSCVAVLGAHRFRITPEEGPNFCALLKHQFFKSRPIYVYIYISIHLHNLNSTNSCNSDITNCIIMSVKLYASHELSPTNSTQTAGDWRQGRGWRGCVCWLHEVVAGAQFCADGVWVRVSCLHVCDICVSVYTYIYIYVYVYVYIYMGMCLASVHTCVCIHIYIHIYINVYIHIYIYKYMYIYIYWYMSRVESVLFVLR